MFGRNKPARREHGSDLQYHSIFYTIQGEGPFAGQAATFIRLTGCNLRCWFCDTEWDDEGDPRDLYYVIACKARDMSPSSCTLAVLTGGEPMRQDLGPLIHALHERGYVDVQIETAGSFWQECVLWPGVSTVISPKTGKVNPKFYEYDAGFYWKYVIIGGEIDHEDGLPCVPFQRGNGDDPGETIRCGGAPARPPKDAVEQGRVFVQPCDEYDDSKNAFNTHAVAKVAMEFGYNAGVQLHKLFKVE